MLLTEPKFEELIDQMRKYFESQAKGMILFIFLYMLV